MKRRRFMLSLPLRYMIRIDRRMKGPQKGLRIPVHSGQAKARRHLEQQMSSCGALREANDSSAGGIVGDAHEQRALIFFEDTYHGLDHRDVAATTTERRTELSRGTREGVSGLFY